MNLSELINLGDKIDMQLTSQVMQQMNGDVVEAPVYKSTVMDFMNDHQIEIGMPTLKGKMILFQVGIRCNMVFYTKKGMYTCECTVTRRYKKDNFYLLLMDVNSPLVKFQRREFFRVEYFSEFKFHRISEEIAGLKNTEQLFMEIQQPEYLAAEFNAICKDISGGGIKFESGIPLEKEEYVLISIRLTNEMMDNTFYLVSQVISSEKLDVFPEKYINRTKFLFKDIKDREAIVRFVFEEERKLRRIKYTGN